MRICDLKNAFFHGNSTHPIITTVSVVSPSICHEVMGLETMTDFIFLGSKITADGDWATELNWAVEEREKSRMISSSSSDIHNLSM